VLNTGDKPRFSVFPTVPSMWFFIEVASVALAAIYEL
jgi:hypothetical protein